ncbi:MAG TPA: helix-turn-helix transcriptional regulator [Anaerolinea thermolimosa]|uniref:Helix-turn-helix transcriptional regulator n=1 Tax=Anaerolinea thermolimosa TaxID=229919 RepID=A0A3D1JF88_9CHLR|nr:LuxR C-terminal-related transcriptional regulator [Anaerolinea thermolimosa]GAP05644.1 response regulator containing a CheY-like receiver domain and an HTH DNA-binding domain [Anaerolinea thermolimosa]HCE17172.1 helix-turn-helix transcriptional regulator [Anaerolinea thermolimosa]
MTRILFIPNSHTFLWFEVDQPAEEIIAAIQEGSWRPPIPSPSFTGQVLHPTFQDDIVIVTSPPDTRPGVHRMHTLSRRQKEVLKYLAAGLTTRQIALRLRVHPRTVLYHIAELKETFHAATRAELIASATEYLSH